MDAKIFQLTSILMGAIGVLAAIAAVFVAARLVARPPRRPALKLVFAELDGPRIAEYLAGHAPNLPEPGPDPQPEPTLPPHLDVHLIAPGAPRTIRVPLRHDTGRILEVTMPLTIAWRHGLEDLNGVVVKIVLPTEITYVASLERLLQNAPPDAPPGAVWTYTSAHDQTTIRAILPRVAPDAPVNLPIPLSVKPGATGEHLISITVSSKSLGVLHVDHVLELTDGPGDGAPGDCWTYLPDEESRFRDPSLPLDRIGSGRITRVDDDVLARSEGG